MFYRRRVASVALLILFTGCLITGCQTKADAPERLRYAVLRFENLTGDPSLEWTGRAASEVLARSLAQALDGPVVTTSALLRAAGAMGSRPPAAPGWSAEFEPAIAAGANRFVSGYVSRHANKFRVVAQEGGRVVEGTGTGFTEAVSSVAHQFSSRATPPVADEQALKAFSEAAEGARQDVTAKLQQAVAADPHFGAAWTMLVRAQVAAGDREGALSTAKQALANKLDPIDRGNLAFEAASLTNDSAARAAALRGLSAAAPADLDLIRALADAATAAGQFPEAARQWQRLAAETPRDPDVWNQLGYTRAWGGDYNGAVAALRTYADLRPADANRLDSLGDVQYLYGRFAEAAETYLRAVKEDPQFQQGADFYKAAWAKFRAGDRTAADALFAQFQARRQKNADFALFAADWLYRTGRATEALSKLRAFSADAGVPPQLRSLALTQLTIWDLLAGDRATAARDAEASGAPGSAPALLARFAALPSAPAAEWIRRAQAINPAGLRDPALAYALLLDGKREDAKPVLSRVAAASSGIDFFTRALTARLNGGQKQLETAPDPNSVNPFAALP